MVNGCHANHKRRYAKKTPRPKSQHGRYKTPLNVGLFDCFYGEFDIAVRRFHGDLIPDAVAH